jgi:arylsulfatase A-like enzyme
MRIFIALSASLVAFFASTPAQGGDAPKRPNILIILADDLGFSDIGCYGAEIATPNLDKLAAKGVRFTQFYNTGRCCPTRASLLTGLYSHQAGVGHMVADLGKKSYQGFLNERCVTIAQLLKLVGYRTYMVGKWHVCHLKDGQANWPLQRGFDRFFGLIGNVRSYFDPPTLTRDNTPIQAGKGFYLTEAISDNAVAYVKDASKHKEPFFLYVAHTAPHWPLHALPEDIAKYRGKYKDGWDALREARYQRQLQMKLIDPRWKLSPREAEAPAWDKTPDKDWQDYRMAVYAAQIDRMDQGIGRLMKTLQDSGQEENTLVLFLSDNGGNSEEMTPSWRTRFPEKTRDGRPTRVGNLPAVNPGPEDVFQSNGLPWGNASNTPFRLFKSWAHQGGVATPLIAYWPAKITKASITDQPGHVIDLMATCLEVAGTQYPAKFKDRELEPMAGLSLVPILHDKKRTEHEAIFWEHEGNRAIRQGKWKLVAEHGKGWELYDLDADRTELDDLAFRRVEMVKHLSARYEQWATRVGVVPWDEINPAKKK